MQRRLLRLFAVSMQTRIANRARDVAARGADRSRRPWTRAAASARTSWQGLPLPSKLPPPPPLAPQSAAKAPAHKHATILGAASYDAVSGATSPSLDARSILRVRARRGARRALALAAPAERALEAVVGGARLDDLLGSNQKQSEAIRSNQQRSEAIRSDQKATR